MSPTLLDLVRWLLLTIGTQPIANRFLLDAHTFPVKPLILAVVIVTGDHIAETDTLTEAVFRVVTLIFLAFNTPNSRHLLVLCTASNAIVIGRSRGRCSGAALTTLGLDTRFRREGRLPKRLLGLGPFYCERVLQ
jgi:hypothetical protein